MVRLAFRGCLLEHVPGNLHTRPIREQQEWCILVARAPLTAPKPNGLFRINDPADPWERGRSRLPPICKFSLELNRRALPSPVGVEHEPGLGERQNAGRAQHFCLELE